MKLRLACLLSFLTAPAAAKVDRVVVYPDRATVVRVAPVPCGARATVAFPGVPPSADVNSMRAQGRGANVEGLRHTPRPRTEAFSAEAEALDKKLRAVNADLAALADQRARLQAKQQMARAYTDTAIELLSGESLDTRPNTRAWGAALDTAVKAQLESSAQIETLSARQLTLERQRDELMRQRARVAAAAARQEWHVEVFASCPAGGEGRVELSYVVGGASWSPAYEARADDAGSVDLAAYATISQSTAEDWSNAAVVLSTASPRHNATPPTIDPLLVWAEEREPPKKKLVVRAEEVQHAQAPSGGGASGTGTSIQAASQGLSVQMRIPERADIPGDGTPARLLLARTRLKAALRLRATPKLYPAVFRVAELTNGAALPLLAGPIDVFRGGGFVARHTLGYVPMGGRFDLTLGLEENIKIDRYVLEEADKKPGMLSGRRLRYAYRFAVRNHAGRAVEVELADHIPVSELDDVKVSIDPKTTAGYRLEPADGIVTWKLPLEPGAARNVDLAFSVDVPKSYE